MHDVLASELVFSFKHDYASRRRKWFAIPCTDIEPGRNRRVCRWQHRYTRKHNSSDKIIFVPKRFLILATVHSASARPRWWVFFFLPFNAICRYIPQCGIIIVISRTKMYFIRLYVASSENDQLFIIFWLLGSRFHHRKSRLDYGGQTSSWFYVLTQFLSIPAVAIRKFKELDALIGHVLPMGLTNLAVVYTSSGSHKNAHKVYKSLIKRFPKDGDAYMQYCRFGANMMNAKGTPTSYSYAWNMGTTV